MERLRIFVCSPYDDELAKTEETIKADIRRVYYVGRALIKKGHIPFIPQLNFGYWVSVLWPKLRGIDCGETEPMLNGDELLKMNFYLLEHWADAIYFIGPSPKSRKELKRAKKLGLTVFTSLDEVPEIKKLKRKYFPGRCCP